MVSGSKLLYFEPLPSPVTVAVPVALVVGMVLPVASNHLMRTLLIVMPEAVREVHWCPTAFPLTRTSPWSTGPGVFGLPPVWLPVQPVSVPTSDHFAFALGPTLLPSRPRW